MKVPESIKNSTEINNGEVQITVEQFEYKSRFVSEEELVDGVPFLKLKDETIKEYIKEERIIDAYTLYILNAFTNPRMKTPDCIKNSTELNNEEKQMTEEQFIMHNFITTTDNKDRLHTEAIKDILNENGYKIDAYVLHPASGKPGDQVESPHHKGAGLPPPHGRGGEV